MTAIASPLASAAPKNSTTVRAFELPLGMRLQRLGMGLLGRVAPSVAGRVAGRLFVTPPRFEAPAREKALLAEATPFPVYWRGLRLAAWAWEPVPAIREASGAAGVGAPLESADWIESVEARRGPARGTALLVHGWGGRGGQLGALVAPLRAAGLRVVAFDHPAHGASEGETATLLDMAAATRAVAAACGRIEVLLAHSLGGAAAALAMADGLAVGRAALLAPPAHPREATRRFAELLTLPEKALPALEREVVRRVGALYEEVEVPDKAARISTPVLVVHDTDDDEVPHEEGRSLARALPEGRFHATHGLGHRRILRDPAVVARVAAFVLGPV